MSASLSPLASRRSGPVAPAVPGDFRTDRRVLWLTALALPVGAAGAGMAKALLWLIAVITNLAFYHRLSAASVLPGAGHWGPGIILVPVLGALVIGLLARYGSDKIRGHGIPEALEAILLGRSLIDLRVAILKPLSSALSIGTGGPFGAEGPIIMSGGAAGSLFAQLFRLSAAERKTLLVAGAAAGMAAVFATPVAAVLLAVELLLFEWKPRSFIPVAAASITASILRVPLLGPGPMFPVPPHLAPGPAEYLGAVGIGLAAGLASWLVTTLVYACEDIFRKLPVHWMWWPAIGAIVVGLGGWLEPRVLGVGYDTIDSLLTGRLAGPALAGLLIAKAVVWAVALGSGTSGGVLAPLLILGGSLGALLGPALPAGDTSLWVMVGMASIMGGTMRSPFTGAVFLLELTRDLNPLPALLAGCVSALGVTVLLLRRSILTEKLARRGQHITREYGVDLFELLRVAEVMDRQPPCVPLGMTLSGLAAKLAAGDAILSRRQATLIVDDDRRLMGIITRGDLVRALHDNPAGDLPVITAAVTDPIVTCPDELLHDALGKMLRYQVGRLPVVDPAGRVLGYLGRPDLLAARARYHDEEELRSRGPLGRALKLGA